MSDADIEKRFSELAARLERIETYLRLPRPNAEPAPVKPPPTPAPTPPPAAVEVEKVAPPPAARRAALLATLTSSAPPASIETITAPQGTKPRRSLEVLIGERWMAWVGAIVVVLAVGFFVKLAYDLGWWGRLSPIAKCALGGGFGTLLLASGEVALRRVGRAAAVSLFGAGLGTLYLTAYATFRYFELLPPSGAFWLMVLVAALGVGITLRGRLVSIGVLSLIGGYLSPVLLSNQVTFPAALPLYISALLAVALGLSTLWAQPFRALRYVGLALHVAVGTLWVHQEGVEHWLIAIIALAFWWGLVAAETTYAAVRGQSARGNPIAILIATMWYVSAGCGVLAAAEPGARNWLGVFTVAVASICVLIAMACGSGLAALRAQPRRPIELHTATLWTLAGVLVATAFALHFRDPGESFGQTIGWLATGIACVEIGRRLPSRAVGFYGLIVGALALVRLWLIDPQVTLLQRVVWTYGDVSVNNWTLLTLAAIAVTQAAAWRWPAATGTRLVTIPRVLTALNILQWMVLVARQCDGLALTAGWWLASVAVLVAATVVRGRSYVRTALLLLAVVAARWLAIDAWLPRTDSTWDPMAVTVLANWQMAVAAAIAVCGYWAYRVQRPSAGERQTPSAPGMYAQVPLFAAALFLLAALSFEVDRVVAQNAHVWALWAPLQVRFLWWTLLWAIGGLVVCVVGRGVRLRLLYAGGTSVVLGAAFVWLVFGTLLWRLEHGVVLTPVVNNLQFGIGVGVAAVLGVLAYVTRAAGAERGQDPLLRSAAEAALALVLAIGLWQGSFELDRYFAPEAERVANAAMARQTALSVYWGVYAIGMVALGFWRRWALARYAGLALLALTLGKVLLVDLAHVKYVYRVLSLLAVGLLFIATSVAYARLASRLLGRVRSVDT